MIQVYIYEPICVLPDFVLSNQLAAFVYSTIVLFYATSFLFIQPVLILSNYSLCVIQPAYFVYSTSFVLSNQLFYPVSFCFIQPVFCFIQPFFVLSKQFSCYPTIVCCVIQSAFVLSNQFFV